MICETSDRKRVERRRLKEMNFNTSLSPSLSLIYILSLKLADDLWKEI